MPRAELRPERVREEFLAGCRDQRIEPPNSGRVNRIVRSAPHGGEESLFTGLQAHLSDEVCSRWPGSWSQRATRTSPT